MENSASELGGGGGLVAKSSLTLVMPLTVAHQAPQSMKFSRQEYWTGLPFPILGDLPNSGIEPGSLMFPALAGSLPLTPTENPVYIYQ